MKKPLSRNNYNNSFENLKHKLFVTLNMYSDINCQNLLLVAPNPLIWLDSSKSYNYTPTTLGALKPLGFKAPFLCSAIVFLFVFPFHFRNVLDVSIHPVCAGLPTRDLNLRYLDRFIHKDCIFYLTTECKTPWTIFYPGSFLSISGYKTLCFSHNIHLPFTPIPPGWDRWPTG